MNYSVQAVCLNVTVLFIYYTMFGKKMPFIFETVKYK